MKQTRSDTAEYLASALAAVLLGMGICLVFRGLAGRGEELFGQAARPQVWSMALLALALGPMLPRWVGDGLGRSPGQILAEARGGDEVRLIWTVLAGIAVMAGVSVGAIPYCSELIGLAHAWALQRFLWGSISLAVAQLTFAFLLALPVMPLLGLGLLCVSRLGFRSALWNVSAGGWTMVGAAGGLPLLHVLSSAGVDWTAGLFIGAVPILAISLVGVCRTGQAAQLVEAEVRSRGSAPIEREHRPILLQFAVAWQAAGLAILLTLWSTVLQPFAQSAGIPSWTGPALALAMSGVGLIVVGRRPVAAARSIGGIGVTLSVAGMVVAGVSVLPGMLMAPFSGSAMRTWIVITGAGLACLAVSWALGVVQMIVLRRSGSRAVGGSVLLSLSLVSGSVALLTVSVGPASTAHSYATMAAVALGMLALGGIAIIYGLDASRRTRTARLAAVFGCILLLMYLLPMAGRRWAQAQHSHDTTRPVPGIMEVAARPGTTTLAP